MSGRLQDRVAIVAGAGCVGPGWGNGRAVAVRFAEEGARIFAVDRNLDSVAETVERVTAAGGEIAVYACDVTDGNSVKAMQSEQARGGAAPSASHKRRSPSLWRGQSSG
jgi:NAD(P)-dependent dehydrogenase (short-subunit alcohol dehydrogenase family)